MRKHLVSLFLPMLVGGSLVAATIVQFEPGAVIASGLRPGERTVWLTVAHDPVSYNLRITHDVRILDDEDRDGSVRYARGSRVPRHSVWVVAVPAQGTVAAATPDGRLLRRRSLRPTFAAPSPGAPPFITVTGEYRLFLLARPGVGAWISIIDDGSSDDGDARDDGRVTLVLDRMLPVETAPPPPRTLAPRDLLVAVDPMTLELFDIEIGSEPTP